MNSLKLILLTATFMLAMAFTFSCSSGGGGGDNNGNAKSDCIKSELQVKANTLDNVAAACDAIRSEVLSQLSDNVGNCNKNDLSFDKPIGNILSECGESEVPVVGGSSSSSGGNGGGGRSSSGGGGINFNENSQIYNRNGGQDDGPVYTGNGVIKVIRNDIYDLNFALNAGSVTNGIVGLELPNSIPNEYLIEEVNSGTCPTFKVFYGMFVLTDNDGYTEELRISYKDEQIREGIMYWYLSKTEKATCNFEEGDVNYIINIDAKAGWNKIYYHQNSSTAYFDTNNILTKEVKWIHMN